MKRLILLSFFTVVMCLSSNSQQYYKKYGVSSVNDLTKSQLEETLINLKSKQHVLLIVMSSMTVGGLVMAFTGFGNPRGEWTYVGVGILFIEMITSPVWVIKLIVQGVRISEVKKALRRPDLKLGILNCPMNLCPRIFNTSPAFGVTLSFHF